MTLIWFLVLLGPLVFFHELGHFLAAKGFGVKVLRFSLGFGPVLFKRRRGETEYCLSAVPLGGYVSMIGEDPNEEMAEEDRHRTLAALPYWKKIIVVVAGPFVNLLLPVLFYFVYFLTVTHVSPPLLGTVLPGMAADQAGLHSGDLVLEIDGDEIDSFDEFRRTIMDAPGETLSVKVERPGSGTIQVKLVPTPSVGKNMVGLPAKIGRSGVFLHGTLARVGLVNTGGAAYRAGLRSGDRILGVTQEGARHPVRFWSDWESLLPKLGKGPLTLHVITFATPSEQAVLAAGQVRELSFESAAALSDVQSGELVVSLVTKGSPADRWGVAAGDRLAGLEILPDEAPLASCTFAKKVMSSYAEFEDQVARAAGRRLCLSVIRPSEAGGCRRTLVLRQDKFQSVDRFGNKQVTYDFGISTLRQLDTPEDVRVKNRFVFAVRESLVTTWEITSGMVLGIAYMFTGEVDRENVGSVVMIAQMAEVAAERGWLFFLQMMALISLNLALLNLLPIPMLDGGHVLLFTIEAIRRRDLGLKARSIITYIGLALILSLMLFGMRNDLVRCFRTKQETPSRVENAGDKAEQNLQLSPQPDPANPAPCLPAEG
ncbi:site-2 protease family protein [Myxococcota bacterium]|nr:site-2 protease family protein [Myxococcota bacterium]